MDNSQESQIQQAISEAKSGNRNAAKKILTEVIKGNPNNTHAWYILSQVIEKPEQAIYCLEQVLRIQPDNEQATQRIEKLQESQNFKAITNKPAIVVSENQPEKKPSEKPSIPQQSENQQSKSEKTKKCPFCAETIKQDAIICRYCGRDLSYPKAQSDIQINTTLQANQIPILETKQKDSILSLRHLPIYLGCFLLLGTLLPWAETTKGSDVIESYMGISQIPGIFTAVIAIVIILVTIIQPTKPGERSGKIPVILAIMTWLVCWIGWTLLDTHDCFADLYRPVWGTEIPNVIWTTTECFRIQQGAGYTLSMWTLFAIAVIGLIKNPKKKL